MRVRTVRVADAKALGLERFPCFHCSGSIAGMKSVYYGKDALLVRCGSYIYNVSSKPSIYYGDGY